MIKKLLIFRLLIIICHLQLISSFTINQWFEKLNQDYAHQNSIAAKLAWESSINPDNPELPENAAVYQKNHIIWQHRVCDKLRTLSYSNSLNDTQRRQTYLLCRGPNFTFEEARQTSALYEELQSSYTDSKVCIPASKRVPNGDLTLLEAAILEYLSNVNENLKSKSTDQSIDTISYAVKIATNIENDGDNLCLSGEPDFERLMRFSRNEDVLKWIWLVWREKVGPRIKEPYKQLIAIENRAAKRNGYSDIGAAWRDELEIPNLRQFCRQLYSKILPLYKMLHGVVRFSLRKHYGSIVPEKGPIPAHLLGDLWSENWESLADLIIPKSIDLDASLKHANWTVSHMVKHAEDFYMSLGLPPMTKEFWQNSIFSASNNTRCHGAAADMFEKDDFRLLYCAGISAKDLYVIHHEMGHIQYYMAYENQPGIFRQGANSAVQESIGDAIMYGVQTPQHLYRIRLINDTLLYNDIIDNEITLNDKDFNDDLQEIAKNVKMYPAEMEKDLKFSYNDIFLLKQALNKIPQVPFALLLDEYRWKLFESGINERFMNKEFWKMALELQGITPIGKRDEKYFDAAAKFHVPDNTPYIRYFLSSFLQVQLFEKMCKITVLGHHSTDDLPETILLNRCDIYGSKSAGKFLKEIMSKGSSENWQDLLQSTVSTDDVPSASSLERYYAPLYKLLAKLIRLYQIPIGW